MSTAIETTVTNNATVDVAVANATPVATNATKKSFPAKYLKVLSIGLYVLKKMHPDVYVDKFVEHMKMDDSIESIMSEIDEHVFAAATNLENEVRQIKRDLGKKPKKAKKSRVAKSAKVDESAKGTTEQIVELANEPTIVRGGDEPIIPVVPAKTKKSKKAAAPVVTETVIEPVVVAETPAPVVVENTQTPAPVVVDTPAPKAKVTKAKVPKVPKDVAAAVEPVKVKEELDVGEPKVAVEVAKESKKATKKATKKAAAPVPSEHTPSDELVEESEKE